MSGWSREIAQSEGRGAEMLGNTTWNIFLLFCILRRLSSPRFYHIWAEADRQCPSPVPQGPESTQRTAGASRSSPGTCWAFSP